MPEGLEKDTGVPGAGVASVCGLSDMGVLFGSSKRTT